MTKAGIKCEDYREITPYWCVRLMSNETAPKEGPDENKRWAENFCFDIENGHDPKMVVDDYWCDFKPFTTNTMTLGYPRSTDKERIIVLEHKGFEIRTGNPEWGAEEGKLYFVIKHGEVIENSVVRNNLMTKEHYTGYCGSELCEERSPASPDRWPRTIWNGSQFYCPKCGWISQYPDDFIARYKKRWGK